MRRYAKMLQMLASLCFLGALQQVGCASKVIHNVNPCGTILNCDPVEYDLVTNYGDWPNYQVDPTCTIPGFCGGTPFPSTSVPHDAGTGSGVIVTTTGETGATTTTGTNTGQ